MSYPKYLKTGTLGLPHHFKADASYLLAEAHLAADIEKLRFNDGYFKLSSNTKVLAEAVDLNLINDAQQRASYELSSLLINFVVAQRQLQLSIEDSQKLIDKRVDLSRFTKIYDRYKSTDGYMFLKFLRDYVIHQARPTFVVVRFNADEYKIGLSLDGYDRSSRFKGPSRRYIDKLRRDGHPMIDINSLIVTGGNDLGRVAEALYDGYIDMWKLT